MDTTRRGFLAGLTGLLVVAPVTALATVQRLGTPGDYLRDATLATSADFNAALRAGLFPVITPLHTQMADVARRPRSLFAVPAPTGRALYWDVQVRA